MRAIVQFAAMFIGVGIGVIGMNIALKTIFGGAQRYPTEAPIDYSS